jgi:uncharacterized glyoxalase superfamily protein PhnB
MTVTTSGKREPGIWANVVSDDAQRLRDWLVAVGFTVDLLIPGERDGAVHHAQLDWPEGGRVMLSSSGERDTPCRPGGAWLHVVTGDADAALARVEAAGGTVVQPIVDQSDYPAREFTAADPDGNRWTFSTFAG